MRRRIRASIVVVTAAGLIGACERRDQASSSEGSGGAAAPWFVEITDDVGLAFVQDPGATGERYMPEIMGGGAALFDADGDGDLDIYLTAGNDALPGTEAGSAVTGALYRQEGDGRFVDVTAASGLDNRGYGMGATAADYDNDGDVDLYVTNYGPDRLYRNRGDGTFEDVTAAAGIAADGWGCSAAFVDVDRDGHLDLYVTRYVVYTARIRCFDDAGRPDYCTPRAYPAEHDLLLRNAGDGTFQDVSAAAGLRTVSPAAGLGVVCTDVNRDGWIDIYVANDGYANHLWVNAGDGRFREEAMVRGVAYNLHGQPEAGMGVVAADFDDDGGTDLFVTHLNIESNTLYRSLPSDRGFGDATGRSGLGASSAPFTGFGVAALDADLDGDQDLIVANGRVERAPPRPEAAVAPPFDAYAEPNLFYVNEGGGRFEMAGARIPAMRERAQVSRGLATGDIDGDGDLDVLISNIQGPARLFRNEAPREGHWLVIRAVDPRLRRDAIGAEVMVTAGATTFRRTIGGAFGYLSSSDPRAHVGLGPSTRVDRIVVRWPDGLVERFAAVDVDQVIELVRGTGTGQP